MTSKHKISMRTQIIFSGLLGAEFSMLIGAFGLVAAKAMSQAIGSLVAVRQTQQSNNTISRMHIGIRGDGQLALFGAQQKSPERIAEAEAYFAEHTKSLTAALASLRGSPNSAAIKEPLEAIIPLMRDYTDIAKLTIESAKIDSTIAEVEEPVAALSTAVAAEASLINADAQKTVARTIQIIVGSCAISAVLMLSLALLLANKLTPPMGQAVRSARLLAQGDPTGDIQVEGNYETSELLGSMQQMGRTLHRIVQCVSANAHSVSMASTEIAQGNQDLSARTEQQASELEQTASSIA